MHRFPWWTESQRKLADEAREFADAEWAYCLSVKMRAACDRLDTSEAARKDLLEACEAWMKVESEMPNNNPCPDLALRAIYRKKAIQNRFSKASSIS